MNSDHETLLQDSALSCLWKGKVSTLFTELRIEIKLFGNTKERCVFYQFHQ